MEDYGIFVKKKLIEDTFPGILNRKIDGVKITDAAFVKYYIISFDKVAYDRVSKIYKILKKESILIDFINFCISNALTAEQVLTSELSEELARNIDKQIMKDLKWLSTKTSL